MLQQQSELYFLVCSASSSQSFTSWSVVPHGQQQHAAGTTLCQKHASSAAAAVWFAVMTIIIPAE
jgi:hypothetical protein